MPEFVSLEEGAREAPARASHSPAADLLRRGQVAARRGERLRARRLLQATLIADPTNNEARLWLAALADDARESVQLLSEVLEAQPGHVRAAEGLRWAWERLEAQAAARCVALPQTATRLRAVRTPAPARRQATRPAAQRPIGISFPRIATAVACLAGLLATVLVVSCGGAELQAPPPTPAEQVAALWTAPAPLASPPATAKLPTAVPTAQPTATPMPTATQQPAATLQPTARLTAQPVSPTPLPRTYAGKWIEVILGDQAAVAWEDDQPVRRMIVSTGTAGTPTITGSYHIYAKLTKQNMSGPGYSLPNVPHVMYFHGNYALHGTYWHTSFGTPMSHGCVNLNRDDAAWLFEWAEPKLPKGTTNVYATATNPGTRVVIHP